MKQRLSFRPGDAPAEGTEPALAEAAGIPRSEQQARREQGSPKAKPDLELVDYHKARQAMGRYGHSDHGS